MAPERSSELLSIFFPMWNEESYIERTVAAATDVCERMLADGTIGDYEIIIVDDKSTDRTPEIADALAAADGHVRVVHHEVNRKLGGAIKTGFATARGDLVLYSDADLPFDFEEVPRAIRLLRHYEIDLVSALSLRPHRRGLDPGDLHLRLQPAHPSDVRRQGARHQLRLQAALAPRRRRRRAAQRGLVHRRRADHPGDPFGVRAAPVRCRLLPAHAG